MINFVVDMTFLLQATAVFIRMHDSMLKTYMFKKIFTTQDKVFDCAMRKHEEKSDFQDENLRKESNVKTLLHVIT